MSDLIFIVEGTLHADETDADAIEAAREKVARAENYLSRNGFGTFSQQSFEDDGR